MKSIVLTLVFFFFAVMVYSQEYSRTIHNRFALEITRGHALEADRYNRIDGSPYLNDEFVKGEVILNDSIRYVDIPMRYNVYSDKIEYKDARDQILEVNTRGVKSVEFKFDNHHFFLKRYKDGIQEFSGLLEVVEKGEISLFRKHNILLREREPAKGFQDALPPRFIPINSTYLLGIGDELPAKIHRRRDVLSLLEQGEVAADDYLRRNRVRVRSEESLVDLVSYLNKRLDSSE
ncbi:hypothetical protein [Natronoflexus pectinivorans]|uniref:Uncharacterized protein n=1 Tax=Natronoflexus pectinivorans TaxID=682526 RepID=A0A4R2GI11_9BACT|nr:hypothetical protein [Natronoflexus pectinivorans]TCO06919.1 hypothetical protein EV194_11135 [Natronoflexus pectinivorans]